MTRQCRHALRQKLRALLIHLAATCALVGACAVLIFAIWYPPPLSSITRASDLFRLLALCDVTLGPILGLVIYNHTKSRRELIFDYAVVVAVQLAALGWGVWVSFASRPVYIVFAHDRLEVVRASDIRTAADRVPAQSSRDGMPLTGPRFVAALEPTSIREQNDLVASAIAGIDISRLPRYYVPYEVARVQIAARAQSISELGKRHPEALKLIERSLSKHSLNGQQMRWLPIVDGSAYWTALLEPNGFTPVAYIPVDPY